MNSNDPQTMTLGARLLRSLRGVPVDETTACENRCGRTVGAHEGIREHGRVFCSEECDKDDEAFRAW